jgi:hypothetical protein
MLVLLRLNRVVDAAELLLNALDLIPRSLALLRIQLRGGGSRQPPLCAVHNRSNHFQVAQ